MVFVVVVVTIATAAAVVMIVTLDKAKIIKYLFLGIKGKGRRDIRGGNGKRRHSVPLTGCLVSLRKPCMHFFSPPYMPYVPTISFFLDLIT